MTQVQKMEIHSEQKNHWDEVFAESEDFFGEESSEFAKNSLELFKQNNVHSLLELGSGQGRDALLFAQNELEVTALDYSETALSAIAKRAEDTSLSHRIHPHAFDVRKPLPFADNTFDNDWAVETMNNPRYPLELFMRVVTMSLETMKIVKSLPALEI